LFDVFRALLKGFHPDISLPQAILKQTCALLIDTINKARQVVYCCSAAHWSQSAITWPFAAVRDSVRRIREDINECLTSFACTDAPDFSISDDELNAQNAVDAMQLKGSLLDYLNRVHDQLPTPQTEQVVELIKKRLGSIGPVEGIQEGPAVMTIPPFLSPQTNLVMNHTDLSFGEVIGNGTFGKVYTGTITSNGRKVAVKVLNAMVLGGRQLETFKREVWTMAALNHPSILRLAGVTLTAPFCIVTELLRCSLYDKLRLLTPTKRSIIAFRVAQAMEHLHAARIIHRDLKSGNILLDEDDLPRVCDFGLVGFKTRGTRTGYVGTAQWMAPEILRSSPFYDEKVDVYSFAVLLWEMLTLSEPYAGLTQDQIVMSIIEKGARPAIPSNFGPPKLIDLIKRCWSEKPVDRPSFSQITATLFSSEVHFLGTNEEEFARMSPHQTLSTTIVHAFDACNWARFDGLLQDVTREQCESDPELINVLMTLFPSIDALRQATIVRMLPSILDFQQFLCMKGYSFIVSLFWMDAVVVDAAVVALRLIPFTCKGFRQVRLISTLARCPNENALALCADLCDLDDIAEHIVDHALPFDIEGMELALLKVYQKLYLKPKLRPKIGDIVQPLILARGAMAHNEVEVCQFLLGFHFLMQHSDLIVQLDLIGALAEASLVTELAIKVLAKTFAICGVDQLSNYATLIERLVQDHRQFFADENILLKLIAISSGM
jgi:serine/threonine protein kinase